MNQKIIVDGKNAILGRLASFAAKQSLLGKEVIIVNCNSVVVSGNKRTAINEYRVLRAKGGSSLRGPFFPKQPDRLVKRTIRGMLSHKQGRGREALKRILCYNETPTEYLEVEKIVSGNEKNAVNLSLKDLKEDI